jgi:hypothetical protein
MTVEAKDVSSKSVVAALASRLWRSLENILPQLFGFNEGLNCSDYVLFPSVKADMSYHGHEE